MKILLSFKAAFRKDWPYFTLGLSIGFALTATADAIITRLLS